MAPITKKTSPLLSKLKWLSSLKGNGTHNALWVTCDPFCLFWSDTTCHGKLDWPAHLKMCTFIFNFTGLLVAKYWVVSWRSFPPKFPVKSADFSKNLPQKSFEIWLFSAKIPRNRPIFLRILTFLPRKSREIGRFLSEFWLFSHEIGRFFREFAHKNPAKFCFFPRSIRSPDFNTNLQLSSYSLLHNC